MSIKSAWTDIIYLYVDVLYFQRGIKQKDDHIIMASLNFNNSKFTTNYYLIDIEKGKIIYGNSNINSKTVKYVNK